jgi:hypothetical protein
VFIEFICFNSLSFEKFILILESFKNNGNLVNLGNIKEFDSVTESDNSRHVVVVVETVRKINLESVLCVVVKKRNASVVYM